MPKRFSIAIKVSLAVVAVVVVVVTLRKMDLHGVWAVARRANILMLVLAAVLMSLSIVVRTASWQIVLRQTLTDKISFWRSFNALATGIFISATSPLRLGEVARALMLSRHTKEPTKNLSKIAGSILSQTLMNILALIILGSSLLAVTTLHFHFGSLKKELIIAVALVIIVSLVSLIILKKTKLEILRQHLAHFYSGFKVFRSPWPAASSTLIQLAAWFLQALSCYVLLLALRIHLRSELFAAAATLFAVNVSAVVPVTPANVGPFQAACIAVLSGAFGASVGAALAYGLSLQFIEVVVAIIFGLIALNSEGMSRSKIISEAISTRRNAPPL